MVSPTARLNRIKYKLTASLVATVVITMSASWLVFDRLVSRAISIALNEDVEEGLRLGLQSRRDLFDARKKGFRAIVQGHARDHELVEAIEAHDPEAVEIRLVELVEEEPDALSSKISWKEPTGPIIVEHDESEYPENEWRRFEVELEVLDTGATLTEVYVVPWSMFEEFDEAGQVLSTFTTFRENSDDFRIGFVWFYLVTVGAVSLLVGTGVFLYSLRFGRRIARLGRATARVGQGDLDVSVDDPVGDELSDLTMDFNQMVREMRQGRERIEYLQKISAWQEFARRLAHEIKNPLTPIKLAIQELRSKYTGDDERFSAVLDEASEIIGEEVEVLQRLTGEFSSFARLPRVTTRPMEIGEFLTEICPSLETFARSRGVELMCEHEGDARTVEIDTTMLRRVFDNLAHNAVEAIERTRRDDGRVTIESRTGPDTVSVRIVDNGPGIEAEHPQDVFAPYYTTRSEGTGLGLAITKKIVLEHGGSLSIEKTSADGTTFLVEFPAVA